MDNRSDEQFLIIQATIESNRQETYDKQINTDKKLTNITEDLNFLTEIITSMMDQTNNSKFSPAQKDTSNPPDPTTVVPANRRDPPLDRVLSIKIGDMCTLKHEISSPKFYKLLIKT